MFIIKVDFKTIFIGPLWGTWLYFERVLKVLENMFICDAICILIVTMYNRHLTKSTKYIFFVLFFTNLKKNGPGPKPKLKEC